MDIPDTHQIAALLIRVGQLPDPAEPDQGIDPYKDDYEDEKPY
jgi:hypothetical protein